MKKLCNLKKLHLFLGIFYICLYLYAFTCRRKNSNEFKTRFI